MTSISDPYRRQPSPRLENPAPSSQRPWTTGDDFEQRSDESKAPLVHGYIPGMARWRRGHAESGETGGFLSGLFGRWGRSSRHRAEHSGADRHREDHGPPRDTGHASEHAHGGGPPPFLDATTATPPDTPPADTPPADTPPLDTPPLATTPVITETIEPEPDTPPLDTPPVITETIEPERFGSGADVPADSVPDEFDPPLDLGPIPDSVLVPEPDPSPHFTEAAGDLFAEDGQNPSDTLDAPLDTDGADDFTDPFDDSADA
jgi:hypothetical protein